MRTEAWDGNFEVLPICLKPPPRKIWLPIGISELAGFHFYRCLLQFFLGVEKSESPTLRSIQFTHWFHWVPLAGSVWISWLMDDVIILADIYNPYWLTGNSLTFLLLKLTKPLVEPSFRKEQGGYWDDDEVQILFKEKATGYNIYPPCFLRLWMGWNYFSSKWLLPKNHPNSKPICVEQLPVLLKEHVTHLRTTFEWILVNILRNLPVIWWSDSSSWINIYIYTYSILQHMQSSSHHLILTLLINHLTSCYPSRLVPPSTERGDITNIHLNVQNENFSKPELTWFSICMFLYCFFLYCFQHIWIYLPPRISQWQGFSFRLGSLKGGGGKVSPFSIFPVDPKNFLNQD